jgi:hypothetical protein
MKVSEHLAHDREIAAIRKLILQGRKIINALGTSQRETDRELKALIRSPQGRGTNGHTKPKA